MNIKEVLSWASEKLGAEVDSPFLDAQVLLMHTLDCNKAYLFAHSDYELETNQWLEYQNKVVQRMSLKPVQYIVNSQEFMGFDFYVDERVLIPRPDTEILVEQIIKEKINQPRILEIGVGSGAIAIALDLLIKDSKVFGIDISEKALEVANRNNKKLNADVTFLQGDLFQPVENEKFDIIVSNPPYIGFEEYNSLERNVKDFEPKLALYADHQGMYFYEKIIEESFDFLSKSGILAFEVGYSQSELVKRLMLKRGFTAIKIIQDLAGVNRVVVGYRGEKNV